MSLSPENYRGLEVECRELIANTQLLLSGKDSQQHQQAAVFIEDDMSLSNLEYAAGEVKTEWEFQKRLQELEVTDNG